MTDDTDQIQHELQQYLDPSLETGTAAQPSASTQNQVSSGVAESSISMQPVAIELDDDTVDLARRAARPPWYASWTTGAVLIAAPVLTWAAGTFGASDLLIIIGTAALVFLFTCGSVLVVTWLVLLIVHRARVSPLRRAVRLRRAWSITGPFDRANYTAGNVPFNCTEDFDLAEQASHGLITVVFADANIGAANDFAPVPRRLAIKITTADGQLIYPSPGLVRAIFRFPAIAASILFGLILTAACNAQSQTYDAAANRLRAIETATQCSGDSKPGDGCRKVWAGTALLNGGAVKYGQTSTCHVILRWQNAQQEGDIRTDNGDCYQQLGSLQPTPANITVIGNDAVQLEIGSTTYRTDRWPPYGDSAFRLALFFKVGAILWLAWPFLHVLGAVFYRLRRNASVPQVASGTA